MSENSLASKMASIETLAPVVASEAGRRDDAISLERQAAAEVLQAAIDKARPGLRAIGTRPRTAVRTWWVDNVSTETEQMTYELGRCVCLSSREPGPVRDHDRASRGPYSGFDLLLREDGTLVQFQYEGHWSKWQGERDGWSVRITEYATTLDAINDGWRDIEKYVGNLAHEFQHAVGAAEAPIRRATERATRLKAIAELLKK